MPTTIDPTFFYIGIALAVIVVVAIVVMVVRRSRSAAIARRFGPEYDRTVRQTGSRAEAERELADREARVKKMHIQDLPAGAKSRYVEEWRVVQGNFDDYAPLRMEETPTVEVYAVPSTEVPTGIGEPSLPPIAPALCNAIYAATKKRIRALPILSS